MTDDDVASIDAGVVTWPLPTMMRFALIVTSLSSTRSMLPSSFASTSASTQMSSNRRPSIHTLSASSVPCPTISSTNGHCY